MNLLRYTLILYVMYILPNENIKNPYEFKQFINTFFKIWKIENPKNKEFSIKITNTDINDQRFIYSVPRTYFDHNNKKQIEYLLSFACNEDVKKQIEKYLINEENGSLGYAIEYSNTDKIIKKKIYFDFNRKSKKGIDSFEWINSNSNFKQRKYKVIGNKYLKYLKNTFSLEQRKAFNLLKPFLDFKKTLLKDNNSKKTLCFKIKVNTRVSQVQNIIPELVKDFKINKTRLQNILKNLKNYKITWLYITKEEVSIYYRKKNWVYFI